MEALQETNTPVELLSRSAMLVDLSISVWSARVMDKAATRGTAQANNAKVSAVAVYKSAVQSPLLDECKKYASWVRNHVHYAMSLPWADSGLRVIRSAACLQYLDAVQEARSQFERRVDAFMDEYTVAHSAALPAAQASLGTLFNPEDYPTPDRVRDKFSFSVSIMPIANAADWRTELGDAAERQLREQYQKSLESAVAKARMDLVERLLEPLRAMHERLSGQEAKVFRDTLVSNVHDVISVFGALDIGNDARAQSLRDEMQALVSGVTPQRLRESDSLRQATATRVAEILGKFGG